MNDWGVASMTYAWQVWRPPPFLDFGIQVSTGKITFTAEVWKALGEPDAVAMLYDATERIVGLRVCDPAAENAYRVGTAGKARSSFYVVVKDFLKHYGIEFDGAQRFPGHDYGGGIHGFALAEARPWGRGGRVARAT
jgi:hypothetical protein